MSYSWVEKRIKNIPRRIKIIYSEFNYNDISYGIITNKIKSHNDLDILYGKLIGSDNSNKQIVIKIYEQNGSSVSTDLYVGLLEEIELHSNIEKLIGYESYPSHMLYWFATKHKIGIIFDDLGIQLDQIDLTKFDFKIKKNMILQLLGQVNYLQKSNIYHGDLKPPNICVDSNGEISLIDFGISYLELNYNKLSLTHIYYNTTLTSGSPEYAQIYLEQKANNPFPKELFDKSQHWALGGLILGILINDPKIYFFKTLEIINKLKLRNENLEINNLERRFRYFNEIFSDCIKQFINLKLLECPEYCDKFKPIILNMFEFDHKERDKLDIVIKQIEKIDF